MKQRYDPWFATVLSFVVAGLGHLYLGKFFKAAIFLALEALMYLYMSFEVFIILSFSLQVVVSYDAYKIALEANEKTKAVRDSDKANRDITMY